MKINGHLWKSMEINEKPRTSMKINENQWTYKEIYKDP